MKKSVLFFVLFFTAVFAYAQPRQKLKGTINNKLPIEMEIVMVPQAEDGVMGISGGYWYTNNPNGGDLQIEGKYNSTTGEVNMTEKNAKGTITGYFRGKYNEDGTTIKGKWLAADKKKSFDFVLKHEL
jgi:hypothetical protein